MIGLFRKLRQDGLGTLQKRLLTQILILYAIPFGLLSAWTMRLAILFEVPATLEVVSDRWTYIGASCCSPVFP